MKMNRSSIVLQIVLDIDNHPITPFGSEASVLALSLRVYCLKLTVVLVLGIVR